MLFVFTQLQAQVPAQYQASYNAMMKQQSFNNFSTFNNNLSRFNYFNSNANTYNLSYNIQVYMKDSSLLSFRSKFKYDTIEKKYYIVKENKEVSKKDTTRLQKIFPEETISINCYNNNMPPSIGNPTDSCWLFTVAAGKLNAFSLVPDEEMANAFLTAIQNNGGIVEKFTEEKLEAIIKENKKAMKAFEKKDYIAAIQKYNLPE